MIIIGSNPYLEQHSGFLVKNIIRFAHQRFLLQREHKAGKMASDMERRKYFVKLEMGIDAVVG